MSQLRILVVTLPHDLGSRTIETNLVKLLGSDCDLKLFRFAAEAAQTIDQKIDLRHNLKLRILNALELRKAVRAAVSENRRILFYNVSSAMFAFGAWRGGKAFITMDWAGRLFSPEPFGIRRFVAFLNRMVFHACSGILPMTEAMAACLRRDYGVPASRVRRVPSLFDIGHFDPGEIAAGDPIKVLYVGGDVKRKGGDLLYEAFRTRLKGLCSLTMVTNADFAPCERFTLRQGIRYGTPEHLTVMREHDIFILPTHQDAGPQVIGEAAAAGLAVLTTKAALGAPHVINEGINGFISETPEQCIDALEELLHHPEKIRQMRNESLAHMRSHYSRQVIATAYLEAMRD